MEWIPCPEELRSEPEPTCPICDATLREMAPGGLLRCDACEMAFTSPDFDEMQTLADEINEDAAEGGRCRVCGRTEGESGFVGRYWVPDPLGAWLCNCCAEII